ncbi:MAG: hypothetical protein ACYCXZ_06655 [Coriobacteriia bacterium]
MKPRDHCTRLTKRLTDVGLPGSAVFHQPGEGYYVARREAISPYAAYGAGTPFVARSLSLAEVEAFVGGMFIARRAGL